MPKYEAGDVAALFPQPKTAATSESGKKLQSLFSQFYSKSTNKRFMEKKMMEQQKVEEAPANKSTMLFKREKKRKFPALDEPIAENNQNQEKKPKLKIATAVADFPRCKSYKKYAQDDSRLDAPHNPAIPVLQEDEFPSFHSKRTFSEPNFSRKKSGNVRHGDHNVQSFQTEDRNQPKWKKDKKGKKLSQSSEKDFISMNSSDQNTFKFQNSPEISMKPDVRKKKFKNKSSQKAAQISELNAGESNQHFKDKHSLVKKNMGGKVIGSSDDTQNVLKKKVKPESDSGNDTQTDLDFIPLTKKPEDTEERLKRTLFVGNLPITCTKKDVKKLFNPFGPIQSAWFRGVIPVKSSIPKKVAEIQGKYHEGQHSLKAFVLFKKLEDAVEALSLNGHLIGNHHIVVDQAKPIGQKILYDDDRSVFIGNLPFDVDDETVWSSFKNFGTIESVRIIRDRETGAGKGFGYVLFQDVASKKMALNSSEVEIEDRKIRIKAVEKPGNQKGKNKMDFKRQNWQNVKMSALKEKRRDNGRKSVKKLMKKGKIQHRIKEIRRMLNN